RRSMRPDQDFILLAALRKRPDPEAVDHPEVPEPAGDELVEGLGFLFGAPAELPPLACRREDSRNGRFTSHSDTFRPFARPLIDPARLGAEGTEVMDPSQHGFGLQGEVGKKLRVLK